MAERPRDPRRSRERTIFHTGEPYAPDLDLDADVVILYGINETLAARIRSWAGQGFACHAMTGASWGDYQDYVHGRWDGSSHSDEIQTDRDGKHITHGEDVYYMHPSPTYVAYLADKALAALEAGSAAVHIAEPEYWADAGHSPAFRAEWQRRYGTPWVPPHESVDARYRASKLMCSVFGAAVEAVVRLALERATERSLEPRFYVSTHSLLNYAHWNLVAPETSLADLDDCDGFVAHVWTGSARSPCVYRGVRRERPFETSYLEYGTLLNLARASGHRMWLLVDPVEDDPDRSWQEYRLDWRDTVVAALLWPEVWRYHLMPWPERVLRGVYRISAPSVPGEPGASPGSVRVPIDEGHAAEILTVSAALTDMDQHAVEWDCGATGCGIVVSDTMMFQRLDPEASDADLGFFFGLALPLLNAGIPVQPVQLEFAPRPGYLRSYDVLFLTYEGQKPPSPECHTALRDWVHAGGVLVYVGDDTDPYDRVSEWWNTGDEAWSSPREHLFETLGLHPLAEPGLHRVRTGGVVYARTSPTAYARAVDGPERVIALAERAYRRRNMSLSTTGHIILRRGPYVIAVGLEAAAVADRRCLHGPFIDLLGLGLPVVRDVVIRAGDRRLLVDIERVEGPRDRVLCSASRVHNQQRVGRRFEFTACGPTGTAAVTRVRLSSRPRSVLVAGAKAGCTARWHPRSSTLLVEHPNSPIGQVVSIDLSG